MNRSRRSAIQVSTQVTLKTWTLSKLFSGNDGPPQAGAPGRKDLGPTNKRGSSWELRSEQRLHM